MTKKQRRAKSKRTGTLRRKARAAKDFLRRMNPSRSLKGVVGARIKKLKGGGYSVIPVKAKKVKR